MSIVQPLRERSFGTDGGRITVTQTVPFFFNIDLYRAYLSYVYLNLWQTVDSQIIDSVNTSVMFIEYYVTATFGGFHRQIDCTRPKYIQLFVS